MLLSWGPFVFDAGRAAYEELTVATAKRRAKHMIVGRAPAGQYLGPEETRVTLRGTVFPLDQPGAADQAAAMGEAAKSNASYCLIAGTGEVFGVFTLEKMQRRLTEIVVDGIALKVSYDLEFIEDVDAGGPVWSVWP